MVHVVIAQFTIKAELMAEFCELMKGEMGFSKTRAYEGMRELVVCVEGNVMTLYERWDAKSNWEAYMAWRGENGFADLAGKFFDGEPSFIHTTVDESL